MPAPLQQPKYINHEKWCANGLVPDVRFLNLALRSQNHAMAYRRKTFMVWGDLYNAYAGALSSAILWRFRCHTGYGATKIKFLLGVARTDTGVGAPVEPLVTIGYTEVGVGSSSVEVQANLGNSNDAVDAPYEISWHEPEFTVTANATYEVSIAATDWSRPVYICAYEEASDVVDDSVSYFNETQPNTFTPVYDGLREKLLVGLSNMWKRNGSHLYTWAGDGDGTNPTYNSTTWTNIIDGSTTTGAAIPGIILNTDDQLSALCRYKDSAAQTLSVVMAVHGSTNSGSTGAVRFYDGSATLASITNISTVSQWYTTTVSAFDLPEKVYIEARDSTPNTLTLNAVCLYAYL